MLGLDWWDISGHMWRVLVSLQNNFMISSKCYISRFKHIINYTNILQSNSTRSLRKTCNSNNRTTYSSLLGFWSIDCPTSTCRRSSVYLSYKYTCDFYQIQKRVTRQFGYWGRTLVGADRKYHGSKLDLLALKLALCDHFKDHFNY